ncbi:hypothetical protein CBS101457_006268 [Exobasidium rhododendri]|nr:hypothetical protein CBS101457_006268 [Exobasidium rhododendri]
MPKGRHGTRSKVSQNSLKDGSKFEQPNLPESATAAAAAAASFTVLDGKTPLLLTLLFETKIAQHAALSRIEAFYESTRDEQKYLTLEQAKRSRLCQNYEAFNFPIAVVVKWLSKLQQSHCPDGKPEANTLDTDGTLSGPDLEKFHWWEPYCNQEERRLLDHLAKLGVLAESNDSERGAIAAPVYLISALASQVSSLRHERLHFLYFVSADYREKVQREYETLSAKSLRIIQRDLVLRKYAPHVWVDEFQAYVSEDAGEFGSSIRLECQVIGRALQRYQAKLWNDLDSCS